MTPPPTPDSQPPILTADEAGKALAKALYLKRDTEHRLAATAGEENQP